MEIENISVERLRALKDILPESKLEEIISEALEKQQKQAGRLKEGYKLEWEGAKYHLKFRQKVTGELRNNLRKIAKEMPRHKIRWAVERAKQKYSDKLDDEYFLRKKIIEDNKDVSEEDLLAHLNGTYVDEDYEKAMDDFYLRYFQVILGEEGKGKLKNELDGDISSGFWQTAFDISEVREIVTLFRTQHRI